MLFVVNTSGGSHQENVISLGTLNYFAGTSNGNEVPRQRKSNDMTESFIYYIQRISDIMRTRLPSPTDGAAISEYSEWFFLGKV